MNGTRELAARAEAGRPISLCGASAYLGINLGAIWFASAAALPLGAIVAVTVHRQH